MPSLTVLAELRGANLRYAFCFWDGTFEGAVHRVDADMKLRFVFGKPAVPEFQKFEGVCCRIGVGHPVGRATVRASVYSTRAGQHDAALDDPWRLLSDLAQSNNRGVKVLTVDCNSVLDSEHGEGSCECGEEGLSGSLASRDSHWLLHRGITIFIAAQPEASGRSVLRARSCACVGKLRGVRLTLRERGSSRRACGRRVSRARPWHRT